MGTTKISLGDQVRRKVFLCPLSKEEATVAVFVKCYCYSGFLKVTRLLFRTLMFTLRVGYKTPISDLDLVS